MRFALCVVAFALYVLLVLYYPILRKEGEDFEKDFRGKNFKPVLVKETGFFIFVINRRLESSK
jgi:hypothetical protein